MKVSIITVCLNSEATIDRTIRSVISQANVELEYIIVDGESTDRTLEIVNRYKDSVSILISEKDEGISDAFNKGIRCATGDIIGIINSDDRLREGSLEHLCRTIQPDTDVLFGNGIRDYQDGTGKRYIANPNPSALHKFMSMVHPAVFIRKSTYEKYGLFDTSFKYTMDRELLLRFLNRGAVFQYDDYYYAYYSMGGTSDTNYVKKLLPEKLRLDRAEGVPIVKSRFMFVKSMIKNRLVVLRNKLGADFRKERIEELLSIIELEGK